MTCTDVKTALVNLEQPERASFAARYFQVRRGGRNARSAGAVPAPPTLRDYGEGNQFLGLSMPQQHAIAKQFLEMPPGETERLLHDPYHECRMTALLIWVYQARGLTRSGLTRQSGPVSRAIIMERYLANRQYVNSWDLVDSSATALVGETLLIGDRSLLTELADEDHLWTQRIALVATLAFIRKGQFADTFALIEQLFTSNYNLVQSASGWMLREVGKRNEAALDEFLHDHVRSLSRTALRGAIYRFDSARRRYYLDL